MSIASHLSALENKHKTLERQIEDELSRPSANETRLAELKRQKLKLKDEITRLKTAPPGETLH
ncbi:DUF465 domain-containing protein [Terrihabitans soli]|uniref:DUF465 domain-containing protein n=1 Tax=Terrihabitans soli TaxID=708113 RepID=A0A6S6QLS5_9HYPH|nr:DUF465 domain-containing protein [Terrihabitans soli]BCJ89849.1 DUF465 domain-containing protein [Terrihabitans soli]